LAIHGAFANAADQGFHRPYFVCGGIFFAHNAASRGDAVWFPGLAKATWPMSGGRDRAGTDAEDALKALLFDATKCIIVYGDRSPSTVFLVVLCTLLVHE
jgi:hypothetical protein